MQSFGAEDLARDANPWYRWERAGSDLAEQTVAAWRVLRDQCCATVFKQMYASPASRPQEHYPWLEWSIGERPLALALELRAP